MKFVRIAEGKQIYFCLVDSEGTIYTLNNKPGDPEDYLGLYAQAKSQGQLVTARAAALVERGRQLPWSLNDVNIAPTPDRPHLVLPFTPPEVWGAAFTYLRGDQTLESPLIVERRSKLPVIFFKATPHRYVGPNDAVGSRADAELMIPEPELGLVLSSTGEIIGYTIVNDISSRDLPQKDPLYICYSKIFDRCVSYGPVVVAPESVEDPMNLDVTCRVIRNGEVIWDETGNTGKIYWSHSELIHYTIAHNRILDGTLLASGTVLGPPKDMHITDGDFLEIEITGIGQLTNPVVTV